MPKDFFILRPEHEEAFGEAALMRFKKKVVRLLRERHPEVVESIQNSQLSDLVDNWVSFARSYGLVTERQMFSFCESALYMNNSGRNVQEDEHCMKLLKAAIEPDDRASGLRAYCVPRKTSAI